MHQTVFANFLPLVYYWIIHKLHVILLSVLLANSFNARPLFICIDWHLITGIKKYNVGIYYWFLKKYTFIFLNVLYLYSKPIKRFHIIQCFRLMQCIWFYLFYLFKFIYFFIVYLALSTDKRYWFSPPYFTNLYLEKIDVLDSDLWNTSCFLILLKTALLKIRRIWCLNNISFGLFLFQQVYFKHHLALKKVSSKKAMMINQTLISYCVLFLHNFFLIIFSYILCRTHFFIHDITNIKIHSIFWMNLSVFQYLITTQVFPNESMYDKFTLLC